MTKIILVTFSLLLLLSTSCKQQTDNSHSQDERINQASESTETDLSEEEQAALDDLIEQSNDDQQVPSEESTDQATETQNNEVTENEEVTDNEENTEITDIDDTTESNEEEVTFSEAEGNVLTTQSQNIINTYCISCHGSFPSTNEEWIANSRIVPGDPENSNLIKRMKVCSTGSSANMPKNSEQVSDDDCQTLNLWIEYLYQLENETL